MNQKFQPGGPSRPERCCGWNPRLLQDAGAECMHTARCEGTFVRQQGCVPKQLFSDLQCSLKDFNSKMSWIGERAAGAAAWQAVINCR